jgi:NAD(P)H-flavin reductase
MFQVIGKQSLNATVRRIDIRADGLVAKLRPGQFLAVQPDRFSRRVPMNVYEVDFRRRCVSLVFEEQDAETVKMGNFRINDQIFAVSGPYGIEIPSQKTGPVVFAGEGIGLASVALLCRTFKQAGNKVIGVAGFEQRNSSVLENQLRLNCTKFYVMYKDGMHERRGDILAPLGRVVEQEKPVRIYAHTSLPMMKDVARMARENRIPLWVNLMDLYTPRPSFMETDLVPVNGEPYSAARDGVWVDAATLDMDSFARDANALKEYAQCRKSEAALSASSSGWARFKKFIWG